jgi:hypothetical protein
LCLHPSCLLRCSVPRFFTPVLSPFAVAVRVFCAHAILINQFSTVHFI